MWFLQPVFSLLLSSTWCWNKHRLERWVIRFHAGFAVSFPHYVFFTDIYKSLFCVVPLLLVSRSIHSLIEQDILCSLTNTLMFFLNYTTQLSSLHVKSINIEKSKVDKWTALTKQGGLLFCLFFFFPRKPWFQILINIYSKFIIFIDFGRMENLQLLFIVLPATHANYFLVSKILQPFCTRNNASPKYE